MIWHPYGMLKKGMLRIRFSLQKICANLRHLRLKTSSSAVQAGADTLQEFHDLRQPEGIGSQEVADAGQ